MARHRFSWALIVVFFSNLLLVPFSSASEVAGYFIPRPDFVQLSSGLTSSCAISKSAEVWCWGDNKNFQVTNRLKNFESTPTKHDLVQRATFVAVGSQHSCAVIATERVVCWGANNLGQLGSALTPTEREKSAIPEYVQGLVGANKVYAGKDHSCAISSTTDLYCWGSNIDGQLAKPPLSIGRVGATNFQEVADRVQLSRIVDVALGNSHSCALDVDGFVFCWGSNIYGQLGRGWLKEDNFVPKIVPNLTKIIDLDSGGDTTCARSAEGRMFCWGRGEDGQIGNTDSVSSAIPVVVNFEKISADSKISQIFVEAFSSGPLSTCAKLKGLGVYCWGLFSFGQVGNENLPALRSFNPTASAQTSLTTVTALDSGENFSCALHEQITCWGQNSLGQLGRSTATTFGTAALILNPTWDLSPNVITYSVKDNVITVEWPVVGISQRYARVIGKENELLCQAATLTKCSFFGDQVSTLRFTLYLTVLDGLSQARSTQAIFEISSQSMESAASKEWTALLEASAKEKFDAIKKKSEEELLTSLDNRLTNILQAQTAASKEVATREDRSFAALDASNASRDLARLRFAELEFRFAEVLSLYKESRKLLIDLLKVKIKTKNGG